MTSAGESAETVLPAPRPTRRRPWTAVVCFVFGICIPFAIALFYVHEFGVNVPVHDEWNFMPAISLYYEGNDWPATLIDHYGEHRVPIPKAIILLLAPITKLNVKVEMYLSAILMMLCVVVCWRILEETHGNRWLTIPIGWLLLSTAQYENLLVGWQFQIPLMNLFALQTVLLLSRQELGPRRMTAAAGAALASTFSFANGLMIWPVALILIISRGRSRRHAAVWAVLMVLTIYLYGAGYEGFHRVPGDRSPDYLAAVTRSPLGAVALFLASVGNNVGAGRVVESVVAGALLVMLILLFACRWFVEGRGRRQWLDLRRLWPGRGGCEQQGSARRLIVAPWVALMLFSMMSAVAIALGRAAAWRQFSTTSRYLTVSIFIPIAVLVLGAEALPRHFGRSARKRVAGGIVASLLLALGTWHHWRAVQVGWVIGPATRDQHIATIPCLMSYRTASTDCLRRLYSPDAHWVRRYAAVLERWHLGPFVPHPIVAEVASRTIEGTLDRIRIERTAGGTATITAEGWALTGGEAPGSVALLLDDRSVGQTSTFLVRADVVAYFRKSLPPCGWIIRAEVATVGPGTHRAQVVLMSREGIALGSLPPKDVAY
jgi:hypothetical protein